ncbi:MAG: hypothetical protein EOM90_16785, partial [Alphaproteobacteria bacterium]|nr:hypothetical protein [Alphaproteobacteria bacterium]
MRRLILGLLLLFCYSSNYSQYFCKNNGQLIDQSGRLNENVHYLLSLERQGINVQLRNLGFSYDLYQKIIQNDSISIRFNRIDFDFFASNKKPQIFPSQLSVEKYNYYTARTPYKGIRDIRSCKKILYKNLYNKIDLEFFVDDTGSFKYNLVLYPGSNISSILIKVKGADNFEIIDGTIVFHTSLGSIKEFIPESYYQIGDEKIYLKANFVKKSEDLIGIETKSCIPQGAKFVIDPIPIREWGTYYGGNGIDEMGVCGLDENNNIYLAGDTYSTNNIATAGAFQGTYAGSRDAFLAKFSPSGSLIWGTYYGGANQDNFNSLFIKSGKIVLTGYTNSISNIATPGAFQTSLGSLNGDAMLIQFDTSGNRIWGTYLGGEGMDQGNACYVNGNEDIYFTGFTNSLTGISSPGSHQPTYGGGPNDVFVAKFTENGSRIWSTYYGGNSNDNSGGPTCIKEDNNTLFLCGSTKSSNNIATPGGFQPILNGTGSTLDGFLVAFSTDGTRLWGTYFGGSENDFIGSIALTQSHFLVLTGSTSSSGIATNGSFQENFGGVKDAFLTKFSPNGQNLWTTYYGGSSEDIGNCITIDSSQNIFLGGETSSLNGVSTIDSYQENFAGGSFDGMLVKFDSVGQRLWGTYFGGENEDRLWACSYAGNNILYFSGYTYSLTGISTTNSHQTNFGGGITDTYLEKFNVCPNPEHSGPIAGNSSFCIPVSGLTYSISPIPLATGYQWSVPPGATIVAGNNSNSVTVDFSAAAVTGTISVYGINSCGTGDSSFMTITTTPSETINVIISASSNNICTGTPVTFTATPTGGGTLTYDWKINGTSQGVNNPTFMYTPSNGDVVTCVLSSSLTTCVTNNPAISNTLMMTVTPLLPVSVAVTTSANNVCASTIVVFTAVPVNGGSTPSYQWKVNGIPAGTNSSVYSYMPVNNDAVVCNLSSSETCATGNPATSPAVIMTVNPQLPASVSIAASSNPFCIGTSVTFSAAAVNGGPLAAYLWKVNGTNVGANSSTYAYNPLTGDVVTCILTSSIQCVSGSPASSNPIVMTGTPGLPASVAIAANPNPFCPGSPVTFTANANNAGSSPVYQWKVNGVNAINANNAVYSYYPLDGDSVRCVMTSNLACVSSNPALSNKIVLSGSLAPQVSFSACFDTLTTVNAKPFKLKGGLPLGGAWSGPGVNAITGTFDPAAAGTGLKTIAYSYTNVYLCSASKTKTIAVQPAPVFTCGNTLTDIRDGKTYPTVQIGSQCWMAANLNRGTQVVSSLVQMDNCTDEKYCFGNDPSKCSKYGGLYQWDEMMRYDDTPAGQGICPPSWHIPTENDWTT